MAKLDWNKANTYEHTPQEFSDGYNPTPETIRALLELQTIIGGRYWNRGTHHRLYLDDGIYVVARTNTLYLRSDVVLGEVQATIQRLNMKLIRKEYDLPVEEAQVTYVPMNTSGHSSKGLARKEKM